MIPFPISIPTHGRVAVVAINEKRFRSNPWGVIEIRNDRSESAEWPPKEKFALAAEQHDFGGFGYQCDISNHGKANIANVSIPFRFWFDKGGEENAVKFSPVASPLDVGSTFTFYFINDCPALASGVMPETVRVKLSGGALQWRDVPMDRQFKNPIEQIMMFFPTHIRWVGELPCE
jgi:hypothetical protein